MRAYIVELLGSMFLMLAVGISVLSVDLESVAPFVIGMTLVIMVYAGGPISGAHYNPMVSLSLAIRGALPWDKFLPYISSQILGISLSLFPISYFVVHDSQSANDFRVDQVFAAECIFSFLLAFVINLVATNKQSAGNSYFGLAIGMTVTISAFLIGGISGAAINPAITMGLLVLKKISPEMVWVYLSAQVLGGILSGLLCKYLLTEDSK